MLSRKATLTGCLVLCLAALSIAWAGCAPSGKAVSEIGTAAFTQSVASTAGTQAATNAAIPTAAQPPAPATSPATTAASTAPAAGSYALIYDGPVADTSATAAVAAIAAQAGLPVKYVSDIADLPGLLPDAKVFIIGGTQDDLSPLIAAFTPAVTAALKDYLRNGGRYLGICGGGYMASTGWAEYGTYFTALGFIPAEAGSYLGEPAPQILPVRWLGEDRQMYYQDGPVFYLKPTAESVRVIANYANGQVAAFLSSYGRGKVAVSGPHPEARPTWAAEAANGNAWTSSAPLAVNLLEELLSGNPVNAGN